MQAPKYGFVGAPNTPSDSVVHLEYSPSSDQVRDVL